MAFRINVGTNHLVRCPLLEKGGLVFNDVRVSSLSQYESRHCVVEVPRGYWSLLSFIIL